METITLYDSAAVLVPYYEGNYDLEIRTTPIGNYRRKVVFNTLFVGLNDLLIDREGHSIKIVRHIQGMDISILKISKDANAGTPYGPCIVTLIRLVFKNTMNLGGFSKVTVILKKNDTREDLYVTNTSRQHVNSVVGLLILFSLLTALSAEYFYRRTNVNGRTLGRTKLFFTLFLVVIGSLLVRLGVLNVELFDFANRTFLMIEMGVSIHRSWFQDPPDQSDKEQP
ncbi:MAG TPA: hypothetical protein VK563_15800 [Puia sp.]|nr:hypothetical protein [Puia sp.]